MTKKLTKIENADIEAISIARNKAMFLQAKIVSRNVTIQGIFSHESFCYKSEQGDERECVRFFGHILLWWFTTWNSAQKPADKKNINILTYCE